MKKRKGFTLMETVVAIVLIGIVASFTFTSFNNTQRFVLRSNLYAKALYIAIADINRGVEVNDISEDFERITTVVNDGNLKLITTTVVGRMAKGEIVEIKLVRYDE